MCLAVRSHQQPFRDGVASHRAGDLGGCRQERQAGGWGGVARGGGCCGLTAGREGRHWPGWAPGWQLPGAGCWWVHANPLFLTLMIRDHTDALSTLHAHICRPLCTAGWSGPTRPSAISVWSWWTRASPASQSSVSAGNGRGSQVRRGGGVCEQVWRVCGLDDHVHERRVGEAHRCCASRAF